MNRFQQDIGIKQRREAQRKEWGDLPDAEHQFEAREHGRVRGRSERIHAARSKEGVAQIRELARG